MDGIDVNQLRTLVVRPVLVYLGMHSDAAENLVLGTILTESRGKYLQQIKGPAVGLAQMEPATHDDIWSNYLRSKPELREKLQRLTGDVPQFTGARGMAGNLNYSIAMCRLQYRRKRAKLPEASDPVAMAVYWKKHYNTPLGKGTVDKALLCFAEACKPSVVN